MDSHREGSKEMVHGMGIERMKKRGSMGDVEEQLKRKREGVRDRDRGGE